MKKNFILLLSALLLGIGLQAQDIQTERKTIVVKYTEDWCPSCGDWGWAIQDSLLNREEHDPNFKAYNVSLHTSSNLSLLNAPNLAGLYNNTMPAPITAIPDFSVDNLAMDSFDDLDFSDQDTIEDTLIRAPIDTILYYIGQETAQAASVGLGFTAVIHNDSLIVDTKVKFLTAGNGSYSIAVWVMQDSIFGFQEELPSVNGYHRMVLKDAVQYGAGGILLANPGPIPANQVFTNNFRMAIPTGWDTSKLSYMAIVFKENPATSFLEVENVTKVNSPAAQPSNVQHLTAGNSIDIYPNPAKNSVSIDFGTVLAGAVYVDLYDVSGRKIENLYNGKDISKQTIKCELPSMLAKGIYLLKVNTGGDRVVKEITIDR